MKVIHSDQLFGIIRGDSIFLAGPTPRSPGAREPRVESWRPEALRLLEAAGFAGTIFVPERSDRQYKMEYTDQVEWEYKAIQQATIVLFWIPRNMTNMPALTTNVEFGFWLRDKDVVYGRPGDAAHCRYLDWLLLKANGKLNNTDCGPVIPVYDSLATSIDGIMKKFQHSYNQQARTFLTADWHIGETRMGIMQRPFATTEEQTEVLIRNHNKIVRQQDTVIVNGDAISSAKDVADMRKLLPVIGRFHGNKMLVRGNHDRALTDDEFAPYFPLGIVADGEGVERALPDGANVFITHYPTQGRSDTFNCVGHIHSAWKVQLNMVNVGVDVHHFNPIDISEIAFLKKAISEFYDRDVWVGDHPSNATFKTTRGKAGRYLDVVGKVGGK